MSINIMKFPALLIGIFFSATAIGQLIPVATYLKTKKQPVSANGNFVVMFDNVEQNDATAPQSNAYTFKAPVAGLYKIETAISITGGSANSYILLHIDKSNSTPLRQQYYYFTQTGDRTMTLSTDLAFKAGESISIYIYNSGALLNISEYSHMIVSRYNAR